MQDKLNNILLYGGAFDPPHRGHLECLKLALDSNFFDKIILVPTHQERYDRYVLGDKENRKELLRIFLEENFSAKNYLAENKLEISYVQIDNIIDKSSATIDLVNYYKKIFIDSNFGFLIGSDNLSGLSQWRSCEELFSLVTFYCVERKNFPIIKDKLKKNIKIKFLGSQNFNPNDFSSSKVRELCQKIVTFWKLW